MDPGAARALDGTMGRHLLSGINHVAVLTADTDRLTTFYREMFGATAEALQEQDGFRVTMVNVGPTAELNVFEIDTFDEIRDRLVGCGASDGFVTDFGHILSLFFRDPDGLECEVCVPNPDAKPGVHNPPGTPALRYHEAAAPPPERLAEGPSFARE